MAYEHLFNNSPIARELNYNGKTETVYFKPLNAGERLQLKKGQKGTISEGQTSFEVDLGDQDARNHKFLYFCNVDANGKRVFRSEQEVAAIPGDLVDALMKLANEALADGLAGNA